MVFGSQVGQALAALAGIVAAGGEVGLPLAPRGTAVLLPSGVDAVVASVELPADEVRLHLALREAAFARLIVHVPWLAEHLHQAVRDYAQGIQIDAQALAESLQGLDPSDPSSIETAQGFFSTAQAPTPVQQMALSRLETVLALIEGWIEEVVAAAADGRLPHSQALREATRRRRAEGGPAEQTFTALVGLELRPRRVRDAAALWARLLEERGVDGRDAIWATPDLLPGATDLDDPRTYGEESFPEDPMAEIERLERGEQDT
jgi:putative hydrolase